MKKRIRPEQLCWAGELGGEARVTAVGDRRALVENHRGVVEYLPERIRIRCRHGSIELSGSALALCQVRRDALIVTGVIDAVVLVHDPAVG